MANNQVTRIKEMAQKACFFKTRDGDMLRIEYSEEEETFHCVDEDSLYEYDIRFDEVDLTKEIFYELVVMQP